MNNGEALFEAFAKRAACPPDCPRESLQARLEALYESGRNRWRDISKRPNALIRPT